MKQKYLLNLIVAVFLILPTLAIAQNSNKAWTKIKESVAKRYKQHPRKITLTNERFFDLNIEDIKNTLQNVGTRQSRGNTVLSLPNSNGQFHRYLVFETPILDEGLQQQFPNIKTYTGQGIDNPREIVKLSITEKGLHAMFLGTSEGTQFIDPFSSEGNIYTVYSKKDAFSKNFDFECGVIDSPLLEEKSYNEGVAPKNADDGILRDYRIAIACTGEYANFHGGTVGGVMSAMAATMNRVNGIYERDLSVTMTMVDNTSIIYLNGATDPFDNNNAGILINQSQSVINSNIGAANYDVGHTFSTGGGGLAGLGVTCDNFNKARGITGSPQPTGDPFDIDFVAHELGHQFGSPHTFNGNQLNCSGGNRSAQDAYEPGSGTTIMAYAGICGSDNVQNNSDAYFHQRSLVRIWNHILSTGACPINTSSTGNIEPTADAGADYIIPQGTPYKLDGGASTDPDGNATLTYTWEQYDLGPSGVPTEITVTGPLVRSFEGTDDPIRYIPRLQDLVSTGGSTTWEKLATVNRAINYRLTVRDNDVSGGQTDFDQMTATVTTSAGPFVVTSQNAGGESWDIGSTQTITWNVAGTTGNGVNESNVNILLAADGLNYDTILASNVPNDGSHDITVPNVSTTNARVMVEAANGIFFNINSQNIAIGVTISCNVYTSASNLNIAIPDGVGANQNGQPITNVINIPAGDNVSIESVIVNVDVAHTYIQDLVIQLNHPSSTQANPVFVTLWGRECDGENNLDVTFDADAGPITCAEPTAGTFAPTGDMSVFDGLDSSGDWTLLIADFYNGDTGTLNDWSIEICSTEDLSVGEDELNDLAVYPNPNNGEFNIEFSPKSGEAINVEVYDMRGRLIYNKSYESVSRFNEAIQLNDAQSGIYLLNIIDGSNRVTKKIVVD